MTEKSQEGTSPLPKRRKSMKNKKSYEWLLAVTFAAMVVLCVVLNLTSGQKEDLANIIVNGILFVIVAVIFLSCDLNCFTPMGDIMANLDDATEKIRKDAMNSHEYLWDAYSKNGVELFTNSTLREAFDDYRLELSRRADSRDAYYKPDIENYVNLDLVDRVMRRNRLNQVAGALTGLGILGTFIGLSLGLQNFNTGSTAEITGSIEPLMNGIKVAFHTSIYGMVFSLIWSYVYKRKLYDAEQSVEAFLSVWKKFVVPDTSIDGTNHLIALEEENLRAIKNLSNRMSEEMAAQLEPNFNRLEAVITDFAHVATADQKEALGTVVTKFVEEMNNSVNDGFAKLGTALEEQARNSAKAVRIADDYYEKVMKTEDEMKKNILSLNMQNESNAQTLLKAKEEFKAVVDACDDATDAADELRVSLEKMNKNRR